MYNYVQSPLRYSYGQLLDLAMCPMSPGGVIADRRRCGASQEDLVEERLGAGKTRPTRGALRPRPAPQVSFYEDALSDFELDP